MPDVLQFLLSHGSIALIVLALIVAGLGMPIPEDIMLLAAGVLVFRGEVSYVEALVACWLAAAASLKAPWMAVAPRRGAATDARDPRNAPMGVRAAETM